MIIAADSGLAAADRLNIELDYIVGDFDSVSETVLQKYRKLSTPIKTFPKEKDKTDTQIAIELALMNHAVHLDIIGATGSRLDHVLANIHLLLLPMQLKVRASLIDGNNRIYLKQESFTLKKQEQFGDYVSLLPFTEKVRGLTLRGFKYPLNQIVLTSGNSLGISNEIVEEEASVEFTEGILLVIESRD
jgi:thiamine pyrophosphokinase